MFYNALYIIGATVLLTILGTVDHYVYNNLMLGIDHVRPPRWTGE